LFSNVGLLFSQLGLSQDIKPKSKIIISESVSF
jgi:hypothetical protein